MFIVWSISTITQQKTSSIRVEHWGIVLSLKRLAPNGPCWWKLDLYGSNSNIQIITLEKSDFECWYTILSGLFTFFYTKHTHGKFNLRWLIYVLAITSGKIKGLEELVKLGRHIVRVSTLDPVRKWKTILWPITANPHSDGLYVLIEERLGQVHTTGSQLE